METHKQKKQCHMYVEKLNPTHSNDVQKDGVLIIQDSARTFVIQLKIAAEKKMFEKRSNHQHVFYK